jgi:hypothetical protein
VAARAFTRIRRRAVVHLVTMVVVALALAPPAGCAGDPGVLTVTPPPRDSGASASAIPPQGPMKAMYQMDARHSGRTPFVGPRQAALLREYDTANPDVDVPAASADHAVQGSIAVGRDGQLYVASLAGTLFALHDPGTGSSLELLWRFRPPSASVIPGHPRGRRRRHGVHALQHRRNVA